MRTKENIIGALFATLAFAFNFWYMGFPILFLNIGLIISLIIWLNFNKSYSRKLSWLYLISILIQVAHFLEEYFTGFYKVFPSFFSDRPWTGNQFIAFNIIWLIIFLLASIGTFKNIKLSFLVLWFFIVVGCIGNAVLHIGSTLLRQQYFSGTVTAFFLLIMGVTMIKEIRNSLQKNRLANY